jgi:hypothetical protein
VRVWGSFDPVNEVGLTLLMVGALLLIVKVAPLEVPPPGVGVYTVTWAVPPDAISDEGIVACKAVTNPPPVVVGVVVRFDPFQRTTEEELKVLPFTVKVNPAPPAVALAGLNDVIDGNGATTLNVYADELCPLVFVTFTDHVAASVLSVGLRVIWVELL